MVAKSNTSPSRVWPWRLAAGLLILTVTALRLVFLASNCPLDLAPDEAHYWDWSRHLDWSYYSKGPLVAFLIRTSCELFGSLSQQLVGSEMLAVRLPAVLCGGLLLAGLYVLTVQTCHSEKLAFAVTILGVTLPALSAGAVLMTIDAPYSCCWVWTLVMGHRAVFNGSRWAWVWSGMLVGAGILAKYTMVLWLPSLGLFLLTSPGHRHLLLRPGFWMMAAVCGSCCLPIAIWNAQHGWITLLHMRGHAGWSESATQSWVGPLIFLGGQFGVLLGYWFLAWLGAMWHFRPRTGAQPEVAYLWWMSAPMFLFFLLFSVRNGGGEVNWPIMAYVSGTLLTVAWLAQRLGTAAGPYRAAQIAGLVVFSGFGLALTLLLHRIEWVRPVLTRLAGPPTAERPLPLRRWDPTCRLRGWHSLALQIDRLRKSHSRSAVEPIVATTYWNTAGELGFYCRNHPTVYSLGLAAGDRHSQYDFWRPNPIADGQAFYGRTFIIVGFTSPVVTEAFDWLEPERTYTYEENGVPISDWSITIGHGFRGSLPARTNRY